MSALTTLGRESLEWVVKVRSKLEEALEAMPDQKMTPEELRNGLKNRSVQDIEIKQSGLQQYFDIYEPGMEKVTPEGLGGAIPPNPRLLLEYLRENRTDKFIPHDFKGTPVNVPVSKQHHTEWANIVDNSIHDDLSDLSLQNIDEFIARSKADLTTAELDDFQKTITENNIENAISFRQRFRYAGQEDMYEDYNTLAYEAGYDDIAEEMTLENIDDYMERMRDHIDAVENSRGEYGTDEQVEFRLASLRDNLSVMDSIRTRLATEGEPVSAIFYRYGFSPDDVDEFLGNHMSLENATEMVHRAHGPERAQEFETAVRNATQQIESVDVTLNTADLLAEADTELDKLATEFRLDAPNVNNRDEVNKFLSDVRSFVTEQFNEPTQDIDNLEASYNRLMYAIEAGEDTITVPNFNTRIVDKYARYEFPESAYRDYTLPDTNEATYRARIYKNSAVDVKGEEGSHHWNGYPEANNYIFHVRSDSPKPNVHRIQEIQSDVQNALSRHKQMAMKRWQNPTFPISVGDITGRLQTPEEYKDIAANIRLKAVNEYLSNFNKDFGINLDVHITEGMGIELKDLTAYDFRNALVDSFAGDLINPTEKTRSFLENLRLGDYVETDYEIAKEIFDDVSDTFNLKQIYELIGKVKSFDIEYDKIAEKYHKEAAKEYARTYALRVTPEQRFMRIIENTDRATSEERLLFENAAIDTIIDLEEKYGLEKLDSRIIKDPFDIMNAAIDAFIEKTGLTAHGIIRTAMPNASENLVNELAIKLEAHTTTGIEAAAKVIPEFKNLGDEVYNLLSKHIRLGLPDLTPLEKMPNINDFSLDIPWVKQGFQEEIVDAINRGKNEIWLTVNPTGVDKLVRGASPQKNYESGEINKIFRSFKKKFKGSTIVEEDGYLKLKLPAKLAAGGGGVVALSAYADTNNEDFIRRAIEEGFTPEEAAAFLKEEPIEEYEPAAWEEAAIAEGFTKEEIDQFKHEEFINSLKESDVYEYPGIPSDVPTVEGTVAYDKLPFEEIKKIAIDLEVDPSTPSGIDAIYQEVMYRKNPGLRYYEQGLEARAAESDIADIIELHDYWQPWNYLKATLGSDAAQKVYQTNLRQIADDIVKTGKEHGYELVLGQGQPIGDQTLEPDEWYINIDGAYFKATPGFLASTGREAGEILGGIGGGAAAARLYGSLEAIPSGKLLKYGIITAGITAGAMLGDQFDYAAAAIRQHENYNWGVAKDKAMGSAQVSVVGEVLGGATFKILAAGWKGLTRAYNVLVDGNVDGAYQMLLETLELTDEQAREIVTRWERLNHKQAPTMADKKSRLDPRRYLADPAKEKAIAVLSPARAGGEHIVNTAVAMNPRASAAIVTEINQRAKSIQRVIDAQIGEGGIKQLVLDIEQGLKRYVDDTKDWYAITKQRGGELAPVGYQWDMDTMAIKELSESLAKTIYKENPRKTFMNMLKRIDDLSETRTFEDLIELRQLVNQMSKRANQGHPTYEAYRNMLSNIDDEIAYVAGRMKDGGQWLQDWESAKAAYSEMRRLTDSALGKAFRRELVADGTTKGAEQAARWLADYGTANNGTYQQLLKQLPLDVQPKVETLIIDRIISQNMVGDPTGKQAILFPQIARQLSDYNFMWPDAKALQEVVNEFAEIYQNDVILSYVAGGLSKVDVTAYLTDDIVRRAHFTLINKLWAQMRIAMGGAKGDATALSNIASKLLDEPLNPHNVEDALRIAKGNAELESAIKNFSASVGQAEKTGGVITTKVKTYKDGAGKLWTKAGPGRKEAESLPMHRIATEDVAKQVSRAEDLENLGPAERARILNAGFNAIGLGDGSIIILY